MLAHSGLGLILVLALVSASQAGGRPKPCARTAKHYCPRQVC